jgi:hypothetical protein
MRRNTAKEAAVLISIRSDRLGPARSADYMELNSQREIELLGSLRNNLSQRRSPLSAVPASYSSF